MTEEEQVLARELRLGRGIKRLLGMAGVASVTREMQEEDRAIEKENRRCESILRGTQEEQLNSTTGEEDVDVNRALETLGRAMVGGDINIHVTEEKKEEKSPNVPVTQPVQLPSQPDLGGLVKKVVAASVLATALGGAGGMGVSYLYNKYFNEDPPKVIDTDTFTIIEPDKDKPLLKTEER